MSNEAEMKLTQIMEFSERPSSRVRFKLGDDDWQETMGPEFLEQLKANDSGRCQIAWAAEVVHGENG